MQDHLHHLLTARVNNHRSHGSAQKPQCFELARNEKKEWKPAVGQAF